MKKTFISILLLIIVTFAAAQENNVIKAKLYGGYILPTTNSGISYTPSYGLELDWEYLPSALYKWEQNWNFPTVGIALLGINLGNMQELGQLIALYPYASWYLYNSDNIKLSAKVGIGVAGFTKLSIYSGTYLSGFVSTGLAAEITPVPRLRPNYSSKYSFIVEVGTNHVNNGEFRLPSSTLNIAYLTLGAKYRFSDYHSSPKHKYFKEMPYEVMVDVVLSGGQRGYNFVDKNAAICASFHTDALFKINECYSTGPGADIFFNNAFVQQGSNGSVNYNELVSSSDYFIEDNSVSNFFRAGVSWSNLFTAGRLGIILDWGIYVYDPIKTAYADANTARRKLFFYAYDPISVDGWNYFRLGARYRIYDNLYAQTSVKTHLLRMDFVEFGLCYAIPMRQNVHYNKRTSKFHSIEIWHPDSDKSKSRGSKNRKPGGAGYKPNKRNFKKKH